MTHRPTENTDRQLAQKPTQIMMFDFSLTCPFCSFRVSASGSTSEQFEQQVTIQRKNFYDHSCQPGQSFSIRAY